MTSSWPISYAWSCLTNKWDMIKHLHQCYDRASAERSEWWGQRCVVDLDGLPIVYHVFPSIAFVVACGYGEYKVTNLLQRALHPPKNVISPIYVSGDIWLPHHLCVPQEHLVRYLRRLSTLLPHLLSTSIIRFFLIIS